MPVFAPALTAVVDNPELRSPQCDPSNADRQAIDRLYRRYGAGLRRFIAARLRSKAEAEDVLQGVFVRICRRGDPDSLQKPSAVLFKTAFRLALKAIRRRRNSPIETGCDVSALELSDGANSPEADLILRGEFDACLAALARLPPQCQRVLTLRAVEGLS
jgi:RNA polymerase sigma-70 factor (ECF subfamily)